MSDSFIELVRQFVYDRFALEPTAATVAGVHQHDHELGDFTSAGFAARRAFSEEWLARFEGVDEALFPQQEIDRELILSELRGERAPCKPRPTSTVSSPSSSRSVTCPRWRCSSSFHSS